uniref:Putative secreted protein n=1 Tax=Anopheles darlingi TaxID=43151 RepID=A0A2M4D350_ANODA
MNLAAGFGPLAAVRAACAPSALAFRPRPASLLHRCGRLPFPPCNWTACPAVGRAPGAKFVQCDPWPPPSPPPGCSPLALSRTDHRQRCRLTTRPHWSHWPPRP